MRRIRNRVWALWLLIGLLLGGVAYFGYEYAMEAETWVLHSGSPHVYTGGSQMVSLGTVLDREGLFLLDCGDGRSYLSDATVRAAMVHWLGDRQGNIRAAAIEQYARDLVGFDRVNGVYSYGRSGGTMRLTLSATVQVAALEALGDYRGTIAVMNYRTGELLCAVSTPCFDPDGGQEVQEGMYWNRFTQSAYVPGSIFKIVTTAAALESLEDARLREFRCTGRLALPGGAVTCERAHGLQDLETALKNSCNCYYADLTVKLGQAELTAAVEKFGVLAPVSFDGIRTAAGHFSVENAATVELAWAGIGQYTDLVNPCGFLCFVAAVANGGVAVGPVLVSEIAGEATAAAQRQRVMAEETARNLGKMLRNNVENGYGDENFPAGLRVCAKSGTGEVDGTQKSYAMFVGFVENEALPLAFIAAVENAGYGKQVCMPMIAKVLAVCQ